MDIFLGEISVKRSVRRKLKVKLPRIVTIWQIPEQYTLTKLGIQDGTGEKFLLSGPSSAADRQILILVPKWGLRELKDSSLWIMDGTFKISPPGFVQVYTIHCPVQVSKGMEVMPLCHILMPGRNADMYHHVFETIIDHIQQLQLESDERPDFSGPDRLLIDYEEAVIKAYRGGNGRNSPFGNRTELDGCVFHHIKCLVAKIQEIGLQGSAIHKNLFKKFALNFIAPLKASKDEDGELYRWFRMLIGLICVHPEWILKVWTILVDEFHANIRPLLTNDEFRMMRTYIQYYENTWLYNSSKGEAAGFMFCKWEVDTIRTTNHAEGYHSGVRHGLPHNHPSLEEFLNFLQDQNFHVRHRLNQLRRANDPVEPKKRRQEYVKTDEKLATYKAELLQVHFDKVLFPLVQTIQNLPGNSNLATYWQRS